MQISPAHRSWHIERYTVTETGELILISCYCELRNDHTFQDWVTAGLNPRPPAASRRQQPGWIETIGAAPNPRALPAEHAAHTMLRGHRPNPARWPHIGAAQH